MGYLHVEINSGQISKTPGKSCGDVILCNRDETSTLLIVCDGMGSGIKANLAATICVARLKELISSGITVRQAFLSLLRTMEDAKKKDLPYAVFTIVRILNDGIASILTYEMPPPLLTTSKYTTVLKQKFYTVNKSLIGESSCYLNPLESIIIVTDGIVHAGMGSKFKTGWGSEGVVSFAKNYISNSGALNNLPGAILKTAKEHWGEKIGDDCSVAIATARKGQVVNIFTGPPASKEKDNSVVNEFMSNAGVKIVCGASTAKVVARETGRELRINDSYVTSITPPSYEIDGINMVTEGVVTLTQLLNIWDTDIDELDKQNPVTDIRILLNVADRVNFYVGSSVNPSEGDITFKQTGILSRKTLLPLLVEKFRKDGKVVSLKIF